MSEQKPVGQYGEKDEKQEKQEEKDEKGRQEKNWDEKWRRDPLNAAVWALILIWGGLVLLAGNLNLFDKLPFETWPVFFVGAGGLLLLEIAFRLLVPAYRAPLWGTFILAMVFLAIGLSQIIPWDLIWPIVLIGVGVAFLARGLFRKR